MRYALLCLLGTFLSAYSVLAAPMLLFGITKLVWQKRTGIAVIFTSIGPAYACVYQVILHQFPQLMSHSVWTDPVSLGQAAQSNAIFGVVAALMSLTLAIACAKRITIGTISAVSLVGALLFAGMEYAVFRGSGGLGVEFAQSLQGMATLLTLPDAQSATMVESILNLFGSLWLVVYLQETFFFVAMASLGVLFASRTSRRTPDPVDVCTLDTPLWVVAAFIVGVAALILALFPVPQKQTFILVGLTIVLCCRFPLMLQGLSVLFWTLRKKKVGCIGQTLVLFVAMFAEPVCMPLTLVGLVDIWANIRKLSRNKS